MIKTFKKNIKKIKLFNDIYNHILFLRSDFYKFEKSIKKETWKNHDKILKWSDQCISKVSDFESEEKLNFSDDEIVKNGYVLKKKVLDDFKNKFAGENIRFLVHIPDLNHSPGGYSLFYNFVEALNFIGISAKCLYWNEDYKKIFFDFKPNLFITSDNKSYLDRFDWNFIDEYKKTNLLKIGLTANLPEENKVQILERLDWSKKNGIDFFYYYSPDEYQIERKYDYKPFFDYDYKILSMEYGFDPNRYYPVAGINRDIDYVFLGSSNTSKQKRYIEYFSKIFKKYSGFIYGPGWSKIKVNALNTNRDRFIYARAKVGLNINLQKQIDWAYNLNERTYMLAACGIPQLTDRPKLLIKKFSEEGMFIADSSSQYFDLFEYVLKNPYEAVKRALISQNEVFMNHTNFHRAKKFIHDLKNKVLNGVNFEK